MSPAAIAIITISFEYYLTTKAPQLLLELGDGDSFGFGDGFTHKNGSREVKMNLHALTPLVLCAAR